jgi:PAS domain S-box-containing protein
MIAVCACVGVLVVALIALRGQVRLNRCLQTAQLELAGKNRELELKSGQLADLETRYRTLFDSVPVAISIARIDGTVIDVNRVFLQLFGYARAEFMTRNTKSFYVNPAEREHRIAAALKEPASRVTETLMRRRDGTIFHALAQYHVIRDAGDQPSHVEVYVTDVSELKRLEAERQKVEHEHRISTRLQSVGALAAGIAHEINTPMQFVSDSVYFLKGAIADLGAVWAETAKLMAASGAAHPPSAAALDKIRLIADDVGVDELIVDATDSTDRALEGIRRVTKIIRAMREFAHPDSGERTAVDINEAIETTLTVCRNVYKEIADVETRLARLPLVHCQYGEINQVFLNMIVNAAHAIEARGDKGTKGLIRILTEADDTWVAVRIEDNGTGIPDSVKSRIFDPFFTTKEVGKGTGQGLAIARSVIVDRHRGRISVESELGKGTAFVIRLPIETSPQQNGVEHEQKA